MRPYPFKWLLIFCSTTILVFIFIPLAQMVGQPSLPDLNITYGLRCIASAAEIGAAGRPRWNGSWHGASLELTSVGAPPLVD